MNLKLVFIESSFYLAHKILCWCHKSVCLHNLSFLHTLFYIRESVCHIFYHFCSPNLHGILKKKLQTTIGVYDNRSNHQHKILILCHRSVCHYSFSSLYMVFCMCESPCHKFLHLCSQNLFCIL